MAGKQSNKFYSTIAVVAVLLALAYLIYYIMSQQYSWSERYEDGKNPYDKMVVKELLSNHAKFGLETIDKKLSLALKNKQDSSLNYVKIAAYADYDTADVSALFRFVERGNTALIVLSDFPQNLIASSLNFQCNTYNFGSNNHFSDTTATMNFEHRDLKTEAGFRYRYYYRPQLRKIPYPWAFFSEEYFCGESSLIRLGTIGDTSQVYTNFLKYEHGNGVFLFHKNPIAFSNLQMLNRSSLDYANGVFSHLQRGKIIWDAYQPSNSSGNSSTLPNDDALVSSKNPLKYVMKMRSLRWAWYSLLLLGGFYLLFKSKRMQRIIPILPAKSNTSLEFISTISTLYYQQNNHSRTCTQLMKQFLAFVRNKYQLSTHELDEDWVKVLSSKSGIEASEINAILQEDRHINRAKRVTKKNLIQLHKRIGYFYSHCK